MARNYRALEPWKKEIVDKRHAKYLAGYLTEKEIEMLAAAYDVAFDKGQLGFSIKKAVIDYLETKGYSKGIIREVKVTPYYALLAFRMLRGDLREYYEYLRRQNNTNQNNFGEKKETETRNRQGGLEEKTSEKPKSGENKQLELNL